MRALRWGEVPAAARMMTNAYLDEPGKQLRPWKRAALARFAPGGLIFLLVAQKPWVQYWSAPKKGSVVATIVPHVDLWRSRGLTFVAFVALFLPLGVLAVAPPTLLVAAIAIAVYGPIALSFLATATLTLLPYNEKLSCTNGACKWWWRCGPATPLSVSSAAADPGKGPRVGALMVRSYLRRHHFGERVSLRARDEETRDLYQASLLVAQRPGCTLMTGEVE